MPFRHVTMFRWADHVDADHVERVRSAYDALVTEVRGLRHHAHGSDVGVSEGTYDFLVVAEFDDVAAWRAYRDHPAHVLLVEELIVGHAVDRASGQFQPSDVRHGSGFAETPPLAPPDPDAGVGVASEEDDAELMERARRAAMAEMQALLAEPD